MKKLIIALLCLILCFSLFACGEDTSSNNPSVPEVPSVTEPPVKDDKILLIDVGNSVYTVSLYESETAEQFVAMMPMTVNMGELNGNEKYYYLPQNLPTNSQNVGKINVGDLMLYGSNCLVLFYKSFSTSYGYTKLGNIENVVGLAKTLGRGAVTVSFSIKL